MKSQMMMGQIPRFDAITVSSKMLRVSSLTKAVVLCLIIPLTAALRNGVALTPPMGFANWNIFGCDYDESTFHKLADAMVSSGLRDVGYEYMLVQECIVPLGARDAVTGVVQPNATKFPHGLTALADYFHARGLKAGIYTDVAGVTCAGYEGSGPTLSDPVGHWPIDALTYAQWGFDMIEADFCNTDGLNRTAFSLYEDMRQAVAAATAATGRDVAIYACNWGAEEPWKWAPTVANLFRNTGDICEPGVISFTRILYNFDNTIAHTNTPPLAVGLPGTGVGAWNDPDMLGVGMEGISDAEGRSQFSLWCILGAPLFLGTDLRSMSPATLATVANREAISVNQDATSQGFDVTRTVWPGDKSPPKGVTIYAKPLAGTAAAFGSALAVAVLNRGDAAVTTGVLIELAPLGFAVAQQITVRDIWANSTIPRVSTSFMTRAIASHETILLVFNYGAAAARGEEAL